MVVDKNKITEAIALAEQNTSGEIRVHVAPLCKLHPMVEAKKIFTRLKMDKTAERNGVLIFVALKSHQFAIIGDQGIHEKVGEDFWNKTRDVMLSHFEQGDITGGIVAAVHDAGERLKEFFPKKDNDQNELSNTVTE